MQSAIFRPFFEPKLNAIFKKLKTELANLPKSMSMKVVYSIVIYIKNVFFLKKLSKKWIGNFFQITNVPFKPNKTARTTERSPRCSDWILRPIKIQFIELLTTQWIGDFFYSSPDKFFWFLPYRRFFWFLPRQNVKTTKDMFNNTKLRA